MRFELYPKVQYRTLLNITIHIPKITLKQNIQKGDPLKKSPLPFIYTFVIIPLPVH